MTASLIRTAPAAPAEGGRVHRWWARRGHLAVPHRTERRDPFADVAPRAEVRDIGDAYLVELEVPGVDKRDILVEQAGRHLTVSCEHTDRERTGLLGRGTRIRGRDRLRYDLVLPSEVREDGVDATAHDGVLTVRIPRVDDAQPRRIPVL